MQCNFTVIYCSTTKSINNLHLVDGYPHGEDDPEGVPCGDGARVPPLAQEDVGGRGVAAEVALERVLHAQRRRGLQAEDPRVVPPVHRAEAQRARLLVACGLCELYPRMCIQVKSSEI